jgi:prepilin peptidase CpaA
MDVSVASGVVLIAALAAAITDVWKFKVHNVITLPLLLSGLIYHSVQGGLTGFAESLLGILFGFFILLPFYVMGGMGAGDVKLMAAIGAWLKWKLTFGVFLASSLAGGLYALVLVLLYGKLGETWVNLQILWHRVVTISRHVGADDGIETEAKRMDRRRLIPFAAMVACGIIVILVLSLIGGAQP